MSSNFSTVKSENNMLSNYLSMLTSGNSKHGNFLSDKADVNSILPATNSVSDKFSKILISKNNNQNNNGETAIRYSDKQSLNKIESSISITHSIEHIQETESLSPEEAQKRLSSAMPFIIQTMEKLEKQTLELNDTYNRIAQNERTISKADILQLSKIEVEFEKNLKYLDEIIETLDVDSPATAQFLEVINKSLDSIGEELITLIEFNKQASLQLSKYVKKGTILTNEFSFQLSQKSFDLIDPKTRTIPFSHTADDITIINDYLQKTYNNESSLFIDEYNESNKKFIESLKEYQSKREDEHYYKKRLNML